MTKQIATYFTKTDNPLKNIVLRVDRLRKVQEVFLNSLEAGLRNHVRLAAIEGETVVIIANSPALAHQLQFNSLNLLEIFSNMPETRQIRKIRVKTGYWPEEDSPGNQPEVTRHPTRPSFASQRQQLKALLGKPAK